MRSAALSVLLTLLLYGSALAQATVAVVTDVQGEALLEGKKLALLTYLHQNDKLELAAGAGLELSFTSGGLKARLQGPCSVVVDKDGARLLSGAQANLQQSKPPKTLGVALPSDLNIDRGAGIRRDPFLSLSLPATILPDLKAIEWDAQGEFSGFELQLEDAHSWQRVFEKELPGSERVVALPHGLLKPGRSYQVLLAGYKADGSVSELEKTVVVLDEQLAKKLYAAEEWALNQNEVGPQTELLAVYLNHNLSLRALSLVERLLQKRPDDVNLVGLRQSLRAELRR